MSKYKDDNGNLATFTSNVTEITLAELPYTQFLKYKKICESTLIYYARDDNEQAKALVGELEDEVTYAHCSTR